MLIQKNQTPWSSKTGKQVFLSLKSTKTAFRMYKAGSFVKSVIALAKRNANAFDDIFYIVYCDEADEKVLKHVEEDVLLLTKEKPKVIFVREPFKMLPNGKFDKKSLAAKYLE